jgi:ABC-type nickel/cobalt efflux system permease component RcnA
MRDPKLLRALLLVILLMSWLANPLASDAHPMGNFSISHYAGIHVGSGFIELRYIIDMAEIPTYQEMQNTGIVANESDPHLAAYLAEKANSLASGLDLQINGQSVQLQPTSQNVIFPPGAGGLPTMKLGFVYRAALENLSPGSACVVHYRDDNFAGRAGWKEIVVTAEPGSALTASSAPVTDRSAQLSNYPTDLLSSPPQNLEATFSFNAPVSVGHDVAMASGANPAPSRPAVSVDGVPRNAGNVRDKQIQSSPPTRAPVLSAKSVASVAVESSAVKSPKPASASESSTATAVGAYSLQANRQTTPRSKFTELVSSKNLSFWFLFTAALIAVGLGAMHALEPGHGKTIVAAYLVGSRGTPKHAVFLGLIVTAAHTAGVYLLGAITLYASKYIVPEQLYPWLGMISGIIIAVFACYLMIRVLTRESADDPHEIGGSHSHWISSLAKPRAPDPTATQPEKQISLAQLLTLGITGGMIPCPAALVVLLGAFSLHRVGFGLFLIVAFSLGLAAVLIVIGLLMVYAGQFLARWKSDGSVIQRWVPFASASCMLILGLAIAGRALLSTGIGAGFFAHAKLSSFVGIVLLGLFLGMRHSTDADHVVAVSTITSRERSVGQGALIGILWGVGHTLTIFLVGSAIILFGLVIPPRVGLSMEFTVALMLILLGVLNLTGALRWLTERFAPANRDKPPVTTALETPRNFAENSLDRLLRRYGTYQMIRPLIIGLVHGLAGSAAVALLVLSTIRSPLWAIAYLLVFGVGTIVGMMLMTTAMAIPFAYTGKNFAAARYLSPVSGILSTGFGLFLVYQIGFVDGLFRANAHWTPQ